MDGRTSESAALPASFEIHSFDSRCLYSYVVPAGVTLREGRWRPTVGDIKSARQFLTKMIPEYAVEFIWIMGRY